MAYDMSGEDMNYPNGSVLQETSKRFVNTGRNSTSGSQKVPFLKCLMV